MLKRKNKKALPEQLENSLYPDDYWLDKEDGQEVSEPLPDGENPVSGKLRKEPMVTGYEALERQRGVRRPKRKITRREKKALKQAQKYEAKLRKEQERADKKSEKREAKLAEKTEKEAMRQAKKDAKKRKSKPASTSGQKATGSRKPVKTGTNKTAVKADTAKEKQISAQQSIPYHEMAKDGICRVQDKFYSKTIRFYDINYQLAQNEDKNAIFENWCDFLNYFDSTIHFQLSFINQHSNMVEFEKVILIKPQDDEFDELRMEFAQMLKNQLSKGNNGADLGGIDVDTSHLGSSFVAADGVHILAVASLVIQEPEADSHDQGEPDQHGDGKEGVLCQCGEVGVQGADGGTAGVHKADTVDHLLHTQGSNEGLHLQVADHQAVAQTHDGADGNDQNEHQRGGDGGHIGVELAGSAFGLRKNAGKAGGKTSQTASGQIVTGGDQAAGNAQRDDVADGHILEQVNHVGAGEEVGVNDANDQSDGQHHYDNGVVAEPLAHSLAIQFFGSFHDRQPP